MYWLISMTQYQSNHQNGSSHCCHLSFLRPSTSHTSTQIFCHLLRNNIAICSCNIASIFTHFFYRPLSTTQPSQPTLQNGFTTAWGYLTYADMIRTSDLASWMRSSPSNAPDPDGCRPCGLAGHEFVSCRLRTTRSTTRRKRRSRSVHSDAEDLLFLGHTHSFGHSLHKCSIAVWTPSVSVALLKYNKCVDTVDSRRSEGCLLNYWLESSCWLVESFLA